MAHAAALTVCNAVAVLSGHLGTNPGARIGGAGQGARRTRWRRQLSACSGHGQPSTTSPARPFKPFERRPTSTTVKRPLSDARYWCFRPVAVLQSLELIAGERSFARQSGAAGSQSSSGELKRNTVVMPWSKAERLSAMAAIKRSRTTTTKASVDIAWNSSKPRNSG